MRDIRIFLLGVAVLAMLPGIVPANETADTYTLVKSWMDIPAPVLPLQEGAPAFVRSRVAMIDFLPIRNQDRIHFNMFEDVDLYAVKRKVEVRANDSFSWFGDLEGIPNSFAIITVEDGGVAAVAKVGSRIFRVSTMLAGYQLVEEYLETELPECGGEILPPADVADSLLQDPSEILERPDFEGSVEPVTQSLDDGSNIDVMIVYTALAQSQRSFPSVAQIAIDQTNLAYENSNINQRVTLVHTARVDYTESGNGGQDLDRLRLTSDGFMDEVHALRNEYCADIVHLYVGQAAGICGVAYLQSPESVGFAPLAFGVDVAGCEPGTFVTAHELGHNMGMSHDRQNGGGGAYNWAFGYQEPTAGIFRTVMAYSNGCGGSCPTIPHFSNPDVNYGGRPTGVPIGNSQQAHGADVLNRTADSTARFRDSAPCFVSPCTEDIYEPDDSCGVPNLPPLYEGIGAQVHTQCEDATLSDWVRVGVKAGESYTVTATNQGSAGDTNLRIVKDSCFAFVTPTNRIEGGVGEDDSLTFTAEEDGCYRVWATQQDETPGLDREYTLEISGQLCTAKCLDPTAECGNGELIPPEELRFDPTSGDLYWLGNLGQTYNIYRGWLNAAGPGGPAPVFSYDHRCYAPAVFGLTAPADDTDALLSGGAYIFYYLVTAVGGNQETVPGTALFSDGTEPDRPVDFPCQ